MLCAGPMCPHQILTHLISSVDRLAQLVSPSVALLAELVFTIFWLWRLPIGILTFTYGCTTVSFISFLESFVFTSKVLLLTSNIVRDRENNRRKESLNILKEWYTTSQIRLRNDILLKVSNFNYLYFKK